MALELRSFLLQFLNILLLRSVKNPCVNLIVLLLEAIIYNHHIFKIIELASNASRDDKKERISPRHLQLALRNDDELKKLLKGITIAHGGVLPNILVPLLPKKKTADE